MSNTENQLRHMEGATIRECVLHENIKRKYNF